MVAIFMKKEECRVHIAKRMSASLRTLVKNYIGE